MNERILKLSKEAGSVADATYAKGPDAIWLREYNKKFAELIVRECAEVAQDFVTVENNKLVEHVHISPWQLQDKIKEHFGVEQ
jgi:hypothetical protein